MIDAMLYSNCAESREFTLRDNVVLVVVHDGSGRLLDLNGEFYALPAPAGRLLRVILECGPDEAAKMAAQLSIDWQQVAELIGELECAGLIRRVGTGSSVKPAKRVCQALVGGCLRIVRKSAGLSIAGVWVLLAAAYLSFHTIGYARTVAIWGREFRRPANGSEPGDGRLDKIDGLVRQAAARHALRVECKERSLCCWALLRGAGIDAALVVGINLFPLEGHCWCEAFGQVLSDFGDRCTTFTPLMRYA